jgi:Domain of unknown function (DUF397)
MDLARAQWRKSSYSNANGGACVEVARNLPGVVAVRDSKDPEGPELIFEAGPWAAFTGGVKAGSFRLG